MIKQLSSNVYFGNWESPLECRCQTIFNVAHSFSARRKRNIYWANLEQLDWRVFYVRLALKDGMAMDAAHIEHLRSLALMAKDMGKLPILCHCQMGGHRGPTTAIIVAEAIGDGTVADMHARALSLVPSLARGRDYYQSMLAYYRQKEAA